MKKKLLFVIDKLACGGAEKSLISLLQMIDYNCYDVDLMIVKRGGVFEKYVPDKVHILDYVATYIKDTFLKIVWDKMVDAYLSPQMRLNNKRHHAEILWRKASWHYPKLQGSYDVAIAYQQGFPTFFLADRIDAKKKMAWVNVDVYAAGYDMNYCRQFYEQMDHVVAVSSELQKMMTIKSPWLKDKLSCIYDIVNQDLIRQMASEQVNDLPFINEDEITIVTVGRLAIPKNYPLAVDTAHVLKQRGVKFKWLFVGEGECRTSIEKMITDYDLQQEVFLLGLKENPYPYMSLADVYVQTSSFEGFGLTIAEAKILHKPVVSTDFDVVYNQVQDRQNGLIVSMTPESVADGITELLNNPELRSTIVSNLKNENNLTFETEIQKFNSLVNN